MFLLNSRLGLFTAATSQWLPFSRSYGVVLPSSLTRVLPFVLGFSPRPPVSVCGTGTYLLLSSFSCQREFNSFPTDVRSPSQPSLETRTSLRFSLTAWTESTIAPLCLSFCVTASSNALTWCRNINLLSIAYDCCPRLRPRLTLRGQAFLRNP